jgi:uncharacterized protein
MTYWQDKVVLITGGSAGLGKSLARAYADAGASILLAARDAAKLQASVDELTESGVIAFGIPTDVTKPEDVNALIAHTIERFGRLDCLVNNVGRSTRGKILDTTPDEFRELIEVNFLSAVNCTQAAAPHLIESGGHIVNIGSLASKSVSKFLGAYPVSKFAIAAYSQQLRYELNPQGVHILLACPGPIAREDAGNRYGVQSTDLPDSASHPGGGVKLKGLPPQELANKILNACEHRHAELVIPSKARWLFAISQLWPSVGDWIIERNTA